MSLFEQFIDYFIRFDYKSNDYFNYKIMNKIFRNNVSISKSDDRIAKSFAICL